MTAIEMIYLFEQLLGTLDMTLAKPKTSDTLDYINLAQSDLHQEAYQMIDTSEEAKKLLAPFTVIDHEITVFDTFGGSMPNTVRATLPPALQYITREELEVNVDDFGRIGVGLGPTVRRVRPINYDWYNTNKLNPNRQPYYDESWRLDAALYGDVGIQGRTHLLIMALGIVPTKYFVSGIYEVDPITDQVPSLFPEWYHDAIVKRAVSLYVATRSPKEEPEKEEKEG